MKTFLVTFFVLFSIGNYKIIGMDTEKEELALILMSLNNQNEKPNKKQKYLELENTLIRCKYCQKHHRKTLFKAVSIENHILKEHIEASKCNLCDTTQIKSINEHTKYHIEQMKRGIYCYLKPTS